MGAMQTRKLIELICYLLFVVPVSVVVCLFAYCLSLLCIYGLFIYCLSFALNFFIKRLHSYETFRSKYSYFHTSG